MTMNITGRKTYGDVSIYSKASTRGFNATEAMEEMASIHQETEDAINALYAQQAEKYLIILMKRLSAINTCNHTIVVKGGMGICYISINGTPLADAFGHHDSDAIKLLNEIEQVLEENWNWAYHLIDRKLN